MCIFELRKLLMYEFHYGYIKSKNDNISKLLLTDTGSLMYESKTDDVYETFSSDKEMFDFSNYSAKLEYYNKSNRLAIGKIKDETEGAAIDEFAGLKLRMYSFLVGCINKS